MNDTILQSVCGKYIPHAIFSVALECSDLWLHISALNLELEAPKYTLWSECSPLLHAWGAILKGVRGRILEPEVMHQNLAFARTDDKYV